MNFRGLVTRNQAVHVYGFAGVTPDKLPKRLGQVSVFPSPIDNKVSFEVRMTSFNATYGGKLLEVIHAVQS